MTEQQWIEKNEKKLKQAIQGLKQNISDPLLSVAIAACKDKYNHIRQLLWGDDDPVDPGNWQGMSKRYEG